MMRQLWSAAQVTSLPSADMPMDIGLTGAYATRDRQKAWIVTENLSPHAFQILDEEGSVLSIVWPWSEGITPVRPALERRIVSFHPLATLGIATVLPQGGVWAELTTVEPIPSAGPFAAAGASVPTGAVTLADSTGAPVTKVVNTSVQAAGVPGPWAYASMEGFDGAQFLAARLASATNLATLRGLGAVLTAGPGQWSVSANAALGAQSSASQPAGGAGIRHVCTGYRIIVSSQAAPLVGALLINLRDGLTGVGTVLEALTVQIPAAVYAPVVIPASGLEIVGTANTAMTLESSAAYAAVGVSVTLEGYDVA